VKWQEGTLPLRLGMDNLITITVDRHGLSVVMVIVGSDIDDVMV
jgi:hypothetical protein